MVVLAHLQSRWSWSWCGSTRWRNRGKRRNSIGGVSACRVRIVRWCHRRPIQKRQGLTKWTERWSCSDRTLGSYVRSELTYGDVGRGEAGSDRTLVLRPIAIDRTRPVMSGTLLETTGRWACCVRLVLLERPVDRPTLHADCHYWPDAEPQRSVTTWPQFGPLCGTFLISVSSPSWSTSTPTSSSL